MKKINVLVTGVGAIIGYGIIKSIRKADIDANIVGMDIYPDAVGQKWCDKFITAKYAVDPDYISFIMEVMKENDIDIVFFGTEQEIDRTIHETGEEFEPFKKKMVLNTPELVDISNDKYLTRQKLLEGGFERYTIPSLIEGDYDSISKEFGSEFLLKPRKSYSGKGMHIVRNKREFDFYAPDMGKNFMAQKIIGDNDHEYTVGIFAYNDGTFSPMISLRRVLSQEGATAKATVINDKELEQAVTDIVSLFRPNGPTNLQFRLDNGQYKLLEVNPRISASTSIRAAFGYNEAEMCIKHYLNHEKITPVIRKGHAARFIEDAIWEL